jgi:sterol 3beta-glucosyltransferase
MAAIMVLTAGSTGDVEPFAALAERLGSRGHIVTLTADAGFERLAPGGPVDFAPIRADFQSMVPTPERKRPSLRGEVFPVIRGMLEDSWTVARSTQPQVIIAHEKSLAAPHLAEKLDIPHVQALTVPMLTPTREFPLPGIIRHNLGAILNRASYRLIGMLTRPYQGLIRDWRSASLALAPRGNPPPPRKTLYCYSPSLVPHPRTGRQTRSPQGTGCARTDPTRNRCIPTSRASWPRVSPRSTSASAAVSARIPPTWPLW